MKVYFKNLDGIRFFAALFVLLQHSFGFRKMYTSSGFAFLDKCFEYTGILGVNLFFILSGFLISYLLLMEKDATSTVSYRNFYIRRILRIWPLYLGYGLILTFFSPRISELLGLGNNTDFPLMMLNLLFLFLFSVNIQIAFLGDNKGVFEISWSVCVEEQFYLMWPVLINNFRKKLPGLLGAMFIVSILSRLLFCVYLPAHSANWPYDRGWDANYLLIFDKLDLFGGGLMIAMIWYNRAKYEATLRRWFHPALQAVVLVLAILYTLSFIRPTNSLVLVFTNHYVCILLYGYTLLAAVMENSILRLETPLLRTLGRISFGIYLFHTAVCQLVLVAFRKVIQHPESHLIYDLLYPLACIVATCVVAYFSYEFYEKRFLKMKNKFAVVKTRI